MEDNKEQMEPKNAQKNVHDAQIIVHEKIQLVLPLMVMRAVGGGIGYHSKSWLLEFFETGIILLTILRNLFAECSSFKRKF